MENTIMDTTVALYARVSTDDKGQNPEVQLEPLRAYAKLRGLTVVAEYVDFLSGSKRSRPELDRMMADAKDKKFDAVLVWKFDRFARSVIHLTTALESFKSWGISFMSITEQVDTSTPMGKLVFTILGAVAEMERDNLIERTKAGLKHARSKGIKLGRRAGKEFDLNAARELKAQGHSLRAISRTLGQPLSTVFEKVGQAAA